MVTPIIENKPLHLASASPRRSEILAALGFTFSSGPTDVPEQRLDDEPPEQMVLRLAQDKALAGMPGPGCVVIGADTAVVLDDDVFGKPSGETDALAMLERLSSRTHRVMTGVAVWDGREMRAATSISAVRFRDIDPDEARAYWQSGEPRDKAGGYAIQGKGGVFVEELAGSYTGVVGLPVYETARLLRQAGVRVL